MSNLNFGDQVRGGGAIRRGLFGASLLLLVTRCGGGSEPPEAHESIGKTSAPLVSSEWTAAVSMSVARQNHVAALLQNGSVLVAGGHPGNNIPTSAAEVYNPATGTWTTVGSMGTARRLFGACTLPSGKVLVAGGNAGAGDVTSAELFDPSANTWSATGSLAAAREDFSMTCLSDGRVLVAGGSGPSGLLSSAEIYSPTSGAWSSAGTLPASIHTQGAVLLNDGRVLIAGGNNAAGPVKTAAIWSPSTNAWTATASMATARSFYALQILGDGRVLAAGGLVTLPTTTTKTAEIYTPSTGAWSAAANLNTARYSGVSATLAAGPIVIGGVGASGPPLATSESYDGVHNTWTQLVTTYGAVNQTVTALTPSTLLVAGGNTGSSATASAQIYGILNGFALYAQRSVTLGSSDHVNGGDVGVTSAAPSAFGPQLVVGSSTTVQTNHNLAAPSVSLGSGAHVGDVQTNALTNAGATLGTQAPFPSTLPPAPLALPLGPGGSNVSVPAFTITTLNPGNYGALSVTGTVYLNAGNYTFSSVTMAAQAHLAGVSGTATVSVAGTFQAGNSVSISSPGFTPAGQLVISVAGSDSGSTPAFSIGTGAAMSAILSAPHGTLSIGASTTATGAFAGFDVKLGNNVTINYQNGFVGSAAQTGQQQLSGYITPAMAAAPLVGPVPGNATVQLSVGLPLRNQTGLQNFIVNLGDPTNSQYRQYLTPATFASTYGPLPATSQALTGFLTASGLTVTSTYTSNQLVVVTGTAASIESTFFINLNVYQRPDGSQFYALDREPSLSLSASTAPILRIDGFDNFVVAQVAAGSGPIPAIPPEPTGFDLTGVNMYEGADFRKAYVPYTSLTGAHQTVALVEFDGFFPADITAYENLPAYKTLTTSPPPVTPVLLNGFNGQPASYPGWPEVTLDIDMVLAMAPGLDGVFVYEEPEANNSPAAGMLSYTAEAAQELNQIGNPTGTTPLSRQISCSWFGFGGPNVAAALQQFVADGQSFLFAAGDVGAFGASNPPPAPDSESESAFMTVVGGTQLTTNASQQWSSETTWNDALKNRGFAALGFNNIGSGGVMTGIPMPWYQSPIAAQITKAGGSATARAVPDVSLTATDIGIILSSGPGCSPPLCNGEVQFDGGTSAAAPLWAGLIALVNEQSMTFDGGGAIGFANPAIYRVAQGPNYGSEFHDISDKSTNGFTSGSPFLAIGGYDLATGWGTPGGSAAFNLISDLAGSVPNVYSSVSVGGQFACGVTTSNEAECWGLDTSGQLGNNALGLSETPQQVIFGTGSAPNVGQVSAGDVFACAVSPLAGGSPYGLVYCWGDNTDDECGVSAAAGTIQPVPVLVGGTGYVPDPEPGMVAVSAGTHFACAIDEETQAWCWGNDTHGELGPNAPGTTPTPVNVGLIGVNQVSAGNGFACAVIEGVVKCWGDNSSGQLGNGMIGTGGPNPVNVLLPSGNGLEAQGVAAADEFACADVTTLSGNQVWCWGNDSVGQLGDGGQGSINPTPVQVVNLVDPIDLTAGGQTACAITFNNGVECWGSNSSGQLGTGSNSPASTGTPQLVEGLTTGLSVSMGSNSGCAMGMGASVPVCWGANAFGQLGDNSTSSSNVPVPIENF